MIGIGNALVDVISHESDEFVAAQQLAKGTMHLIDEARAQELYDAMGPGYTLLRFDPAIDVSGLVDAAARRKVPLVVLDVRSSDEALTTLYPQSLVLSRPDQHVAWRGNAVPDKPDELIDLIRGAATAFRTRRAA